MWEEREELHMKFAVWSSEASSAQWPRGGDVEVSHGVVITRTHFLSWQSLASTAYLYEIDKILPRSVISQKKASFNSSFYTPKTEAPTWGVSTGGKVEHLLYIFPFDHLMFCIAFNPDFVFFFNFIFDLKVNPFMLWNAAASIPGIPGFTPGK